jgi:hypothetical protein
MLTVINITSTLIKHNGMDTLKIKYGNLHYWMYLHPMMLLIMLLMLLIQTDSMIAECPRRDCNRLEDKIKKVRKQILS